LYCLRRIRVVIETPEGWEETRAIVNVPADKQHERGYVHITRVLNNPEQKEQVLVEMRRDMEAFQRKYATLLRVNEALRDGVLKILEALP